MNVELTTLQKRLLTIIQSDFPIVSRPYAALAERLDSTEESILEATRSLYDQGLIRRIGAVFDPAHLGYVSTLAALHAPQDKVEAFAAIVDAYDEVTHDYLREGDLNLWFTVIAPDRARIETVLAQICEHTGVERVLDLPATQIFKIRVDFAFDGENRERQSGDRPGSSPSQTRATTKTFDAEQRQLVRVLQGDIGCDANPFASLAEACDMNEEELLATIHEWKKQGVIRRFGATVRHRNLGVSANAMTVWDVPADMTQEAGRIMATFDEVSHCYERTPDVAWPYDLYTMIHGTSQAQCESIAADIRNALESEGIHVPAPRLLYSSKEFKKRSMRYFSEKEGD